MSDENNQLSKINKDTTLAEALSLEGSEEIMAKHNLPCLTCPMASMEMNELTLGQICEMYQLDLESLLKDLNNLRPSGR